MKLTPFQRPQRGRSALRFVATLFVALGVIAFAASIAVANNPGHTTGPPVVNPGGGHTPVKYCHKPGTPAQQEEHTSDSNSLAPHLAHGDTLGSCPTLVVDACPDNVLNPGNQVAGTICVIAATDACPDNVLNPGNQVAGTICVIAATDACPDNVLNPGNQTAGTICVIAATDACPDNVLNPGNQATGATCVVATTDACPDDVLNPGTQAAGTTCAVGSAADACPDETLNPGVQAVGTVCAAGSSSNTGGDTPGEAEAGGAVDNGDPAQPGVALEYDSLAPGAQADPAATNGETVVAGAADGPTTIAGGANSPSAVVTPTGELPYTGLSTLQIALMGFMLLGLGSLAWLVGSAPRSEGALAAA